MSEFLSEPWVKLAAAFLTALAAILTWLRQWRKEHRIYDANEEAARQSIPYVMQNLARAGTPMDAIQVNAINDVIKTGERLALVIERQTEETRRAGTATERLTEEVRRNQDLFRDLNENLKKRPSRS